MSNNWEKLGVEKNTPMDEVEKAYKKLVKKYHPDLNPNNPEALSKMQEINAAYTALKNGDTGEQQMPPHGFYSGGGFNPNDIFDMLRRAGMGGGPQGNSNINLQTHVPISILINGGKVPVKASMQQIINNRIVTKRIEKELIFEPDSPMDKIFVFNGEGTNDNPNAPPGDLIIHIVIQGENGIETNGNDLHKQIDLNVFDSLTGGKYKVETPSGKTLEINIPQGSQHGSSVRIKNHGLNTTKGIRGHMFIHFNIIIPKITDKNIIDELQILKEKIKN